MVEGSEAPQGADKAVAWILQHKRGLGIGATVVAAAAVVVWFMVASGQRKEAFATQALEVAREAAEAGNLPLAASELQQVIDTYRGTDAALEATLSLNVVRMASGQDQLAADDLQRFLGRNPPQAFAARGGILLGTALENLGRAPEAAQAYEAVAAKAGMEFAKADALLQAARAYRTAGDAEKAVALLQRITEEFPDTPAAVEAQVRLGELGAGA